MSFGIDGMLYLRVAQVTLHLMFGDMVFVNKGDIFYTGKVFRLVVALRAHNFRHIAVAPDDTVVAIGAMDPLLEIIGVVEGLLRIPDGNGAVGYGMALCAECRCCGLRCLHPVFKVTKEADLLGDRNMIPHSYLGMTTRAPERATPSRLGQVRGMVERDPLEHDFALKKPFFMTPFPEARSIIHFGVRPGRVFAGYH